MNLYDVMIPQYLRTLTAAEAILKKAAAHADMKKFDVQVLLNDRLAPDMLPLGKQIQIASDAAKISAGFLTGTTPPKFEDNEVTFAEFQARLAKTKEYLSTLKREQFEGAEKRKVELPRNPGEFMTGIDYAMSHAMPNFFFHMTTMYAILRHNGVEIGKKDFLGARPFQKL
ncbi:MAG: DUF1993 domain-containing protein [Bdellovibrionaceae bacterium]|nr:DUF1993 domain-containing protein [Pseudobdellovibrionaceae bacterium]